MQRTSCTYFCAQNLSGPQEPPYHGRFLVGPHHLEWDAIAANAERAVVLAPRDHGKSIYWSCGYPIWKCAYGKRGDIGYIFSSNQDRANELLQIIVDELLNNPKLRWLVPPRHDNKWSKRRIILTTGSEIRARGFGVRVRGGHPKWIVSDDSLSDATLWSETQRKKDTDYFFSAITNMVVPGGQIIVPGTPFHMDDLYAHLQNLERAKYKSAKYIVWKKPAVDEKGQALWPARYDEERLAAKKEEIGSVRFTREYLVQPVSDDMSLFPSYLFEGEPIKQRAISLGRYVEGVPRKYPLRPGDCDPLYIPHPAEYWEQLGITTRFTGIDIALSAETGADYFVMVTLGLDAAGNRWLCDLFYARGLSFHAQLDTIHPALVYIEDNAMQRVWGDELIRTSDLPIKKFTTTAQIKNALDKGIFVLRPLFENKKHRLPVGDAESVERVQWLISQFVQFAWVDGKLEGVGAHDDGPVAYWISDAACRRGGSAFASFGDANTRSADPRAQPKKPMGGAVPVAPGAPVPDARAAAPKSTGSLVSGDPSAAKLWSAQPFYRGR
jgi:hypothetical protein